MTDSAAYLGYLGFAEGVPFLVFTMLGGIVADRIPKRTLVQITQISRMFLAFALAALTFSGLLEPWHILVLSLVLGVVKAVDIPARLSFFRDLVGRKHLSNAISINSFMINTASIVGPLLAGVVYSAFGAGWCFLINGLTFLGIIIAFKNMEVEEEDHHPQKQSALADIRECFQYVREDSPTKVILISLFVMSAVGFSVFKLLPAWAVNVLDGGVNTNSLLSSAKGAGAVLGALVLAYLTLRIRRGKIWIVGSFTFPIAMILIALIPSLPFSLIMFVLLGWAFTVLSNIANGIIQGRVPDDLRGRVVGMYTLLLHGGLTIGSLIMGFLAEHVSEIWASLACGILLLAFSIFMTIYRPQIRKMK
jgi:MFS family permease